MLLIPTASSTTLTEPLKLSHLEGKAPLRVCIEGPRAVIERFEGCRYSMGWHGWSGNGLSLDWGDGQPVGRFEDPAQKGTSCAHLRCHEFKFPGEYAVSLRLWHPGPDDGPVLDWKGGTSVRVLGQVQPPRFELLSPKEPQTVGYAGEPVPRWKLEAGGKVDLRFLVLSKSGKTLFEKTDRGIAYHGEGRESFSISPEKYEDLLRDEGGSFFYRFEVLRDGKIARSVDSPALRMTREIPAHDPNRIQVEPRQGKAPLQVNVRHGVFLKACHAYKVDWGDGTPPTEHIQGPVKDGCRVDPTDLSLSHVYKRAGRFKLRLYFDEGATLRDLKKQGPHHAFDIKVGAP